MWTEEQRAICRRDEDRYPSNLIDAEWERLKPLIPEASPRGRPRKTDMRAAVNAIFYLLRTGCPWRYLPRDEFPPRSTVYNIFRKFQKDGVCEAVWEELHMALREELGREASVVACTCSNLTDGAFFGPYCRMGHMNIVSGPAVLAAFSSNYFLQA